MFYPSAIASAVASANADAEILTPLTLTSLLLFIAPTTSNLYEGSVLPIPTFGAAVWTTTIKDAWKAKLIALKSS